MSLVQVIECIRCGNSESIPYILGNPLTPWDVWDKGCPKCGCSKVDITVIFDKSGRIRDATILSSKETETE